MSELEATTFINTLAVAFAQDIEEGELVLLAAMFTQFADTLATVAALRALTPETETKK